MPLPGILASPLFQQAAIAGIGWGANKLLGGEAKRPELTGVMNGAYMRGMRSLNKTATRQRQRSEAGAAARGESGSGGAYRSALQTGAALDAAASLEGMAAEDIARARAREKMIAFEEARRREQARLNAVGGFAQTAAFAAAMKQDKEGNVTDKVTADQEVTPRLAVATDLSMMPEQIRRRRAPLAPLAEMPSLEARDPYGLLRMGPVFR